MIPVEIPEAPRADNQPVRARPCGIFGTEPVSILEFRTGALR